MVPGLGLDEATPAASPQPSTEGEAGSDAPDDLTVIRGIGEKTAQKLAENGITTLEQIAGLTPERIAELDEKLGLGGRIERDGWIDKAKALTAE